MVAARFSQKEIYQSFSTGFITTIIGPRRVGKSSLVQAYVESHPEHDWVLFNCDDFELRRNLAQGNILRRLIEESVLRHIGEGKQIWVVIDEVQKCPQCFDQIKLIYDEFKDKSAVKFILTGSALLELHRFSAETLAGRIDIHYLAEFNLYESLELLENIALPEQSTLELIFKQDVDALKKQVQKLAPLRSKVLAMLKEQLIWGGLPEVLLSANEEQKRRYLNNYLQTYLEKDIRPITNISNLELYRRLLDVIAEQTGSLRDDSKLLNALDCSRDTLKKYRGILEATLMYQELYPFIASSIKRISKAPKGYLINNGLISYLTGIDKLDLLEKVNMLGHRFENWVFKELQAVLSRQAHRSTISYWRMSSGREVDFVVDYKPYVFPFEITYAEKVQPKKVKTLKHFLENESQAAFACYIYMGDFRVDEEDRIYYLPAWCLN